ncbi:hypothetical protein LZC95_24980 [Pendulispora brunnea]|uniref:Uncharacterized protein n=1 Tax=Pendulispora brunnea TaxID=2905690 RepID=A0ABZ2KQR0_9BACT
MLPPKTPPPRPTAAVEEDENETIVLNRRSLPDPSEDDTRKLIADDSMSGDEFTRLHPKNLGRGPVDEERTNFRPFQNAGARGEPEPDEAETRIPLHAPAAGAPAHMAQTRRASLTAFAPLTPERIQAQLDAAREARRMNRVHEPEGVFAAPPVARSMHAAPQPTVSWAFALAAMAIIGSVATVAIVEGSGDELLRTGAAFVDPSMARTEEPQPRPATPSTQPISVMDLPPAPPPPVAASAPPAETAPRAAPAPEPRHSAAPKPVVKPPRAPATSKQPAKGRGGASDEDVANAAAADALARAQLQQSL